MDDDMAYRIAYAAVPNVDRVKAAALVKLEDGVCRWDPDLGQPIWSKRSSSTGWCDAFGKDV